MQRLWQQKLKLNYSKDVVDIVQFGSSVIEGKEYRDVDIAVIFHNISFKEQLDQAYEVKKQLANLINKDKEIHISQFDFYSLLNASNFAREGILFYGKSLLTGKNFAFRFGLKPVLQILYNLEKFEKKDKVRFHYLLRGKGGKYGLLRKYDGRLVKPGMIEIAPEYEDVFVTAISGVIKDFEVRKIFVAEMFGKKYKTFVTSIRRDEK
ncbi:MAG: hypothetical protein Q8P57_01045 [Candidatus Pacearchaeota archaeon]|nr:hypothetical protein [Candidatus Pacearchaeota archaeon]